MDMMETNYERKRINFEKILFCIKHIYSVLNMGYNDLYIYTYVLYIISLVLKSLSSVCYSVSSLICSHH